MNARGLRLLSVLVSLSTACMVPPASQPTPSSAPTETTATTSTTSAPTTPSTEPAAPASSPSSVASDGAPEAALPPSALKIGGVSLSDVTPEQVVSAFTKLGYQARPSNPSAFSGIPVWDDRFRVYSFEVLKNNSAVGTVELVRPVKGRKPGARKAGEFIKDAFDAAGAGGLIDGNGFVDSPSDTALTAVINKKEAGSALQFLMKVMKQK